MKQIPFLSTKFYNHLEAMIVQSSNEVGPVTPLGHELLVLRDELRLLAPDPLHVVLELLDLVDFPLPAISCRNLGNRVIG